MISTPAISFRGLRITYASNPPNSRSGSALRLSAWNSPWQVARLKRTQQQAVGDSWAGQMRHIGYWPIRPDDSHFFHNHQLVVSAYGDTEPLPKPLTNGSFVKKRTQFLSG